MASNTFWVWVQHRRWSLTGRLIWSGRDRDTGEKNRERNTTQRETREDRERRGEIKEDGVRDVCGRLPFPCAGRLRGV